MYYSNVFVLLMSEISDQISCF